jgi:hypothetical protein
LLEQPETKRCTIEVSASRHFVSAQAGSFAVAHSPHIQNCVLKLSFFVSRKSKGIILKGVSLND